MPRKRKHPGHPITTGSASTPLVCYRVSKEQHAELEAEARTLPRVGRRFMTASAVAKRRAFPVTGNDEPKQREGR